MVQVSAEIVSPLPDRPYEGFLLVSSELTPLASATFEVGRTGEEETVINRLLEKSLRRSNAVDREALCIIAGQKVSFELHFLREVKELTICIGRSG